MIECEVHNCQYNHYGKCTRISITIDKNAGCTVGRLEFTRAAIGSSGYSNGPSAFWAGISPSPATASFVSCQSIDVIDVEPSMFVSNSIVEEEKEENVGSKDEQSELSK